ncbi:MAG: ABC transporter permease [Candidatus Neomarinimicrobiota bacterium]|jgi:putative ABC transport system permease protein
MGDVLDINYLRLFLGYALLLIPVSILWYYKTGLVKDTIISVLRMTVQLLLVGLYLEYIFRLNNNWLNIAWVLIMSILASYTIIQRSGLKFKVFLAPVLISTLISILVIDAYFLGFVIKLDNIFDARYLIPITGMLMGNTIRNVIISLNSFYNRIDDEQNLYRWHLANGANRHESLLPFMRDALKKAFNPVIANTAIMGLISLPGMMTGQILGGSNPNVAVKYQIMLMITIFSSGILNVLLSITFSNRFAFDAYGNLKKDIFRVK